MKHTQGKVYIDSRIATTSIKSENGMDICLMVAGVKGLNLANAELIVEAFNVTNESGLTPRQLLEQRNELLSALIELRDGEYPFINGGLYSFIVEAINNAQNK